jgi:predicted transcriptional regulator of viral defense system
MGRKVDPKRREVVLEFAKRHGAFIQTKDLEELGVHKRVLYEMRDEGLFRQMSKGLFVLDSVVDIPHSDFVLAMAQVPNGVVCLTSALYYYEMTDQIPQSVCLAIPQGYKPRKVLYPPIQFYWSSEAIYSVGLVTVDLALLSGGKRINDLHCPIKIYSKEKTVVDCFKFRNRIGIEVAIQALKYYCRTPGIDISLLLRLADTLRVKDIVELHLRAILHG